MASSSIGSGHLGFFANPINSSTGDIADVERRSWQGGDEARRSITSRSSALPLETSEIEQQSTTVSFVHRIVETIQAFGTLGFTSFGGPGVHVIILKRRFVESKKWLDETTFIDLFTLGNALPGPGSTQLAFSIAVVRNGTLCGILAFLLWSLPGALTMLGLGLGVKQFPERLPEIVLALFTGINASAVGLIALAAFQLSSSTITDTISRFILLTSASIGICYHAPWMYPVLVFVGGLSTLLFDYRRQILQRVKSFRNRPQVSSSARSDELTLSQLPANVNRLSRESDVQSNSEIRQRGVQSRQDNDQIQHQSTSPRISSTMLPLRVPTVFVAIMFGVSLMALLLVCLILRSILSDPTAPRLLDFMTNMVVAGTIIFGGGPVVIPLLRGYSVDTGWVSSRDFLLGFALLQAMPGPNFNFAAYLGALACPQSPVLGALLGWFGIFSPGIMLKLALLPIYNRWRKSLIAKSILRGLNSAAVGLVFTAVWQLFLVGYIHQSANGQSSSTSSTSSTSSPLTSSPWWGVVAAWSFVLSHWCNVPAAFTILFGGAPAGLIWYGIVGKHIQS